MSLPEISDCGGGWGDTGVNGDLWGGHSLCATTEVRADPKFRGSPSVSPMEQAGRSRGLRMSPARASSRLVPGGRERGTREGEGEGDEGGGGRGGRGRGTREGEGEGDEGGGGRGGRGRGRERGAREGTLGERSGAARTHLACPMALPALAQPTSTEAWSASSLKIMHNIDFVIQECSIYQPPCNEWRWCSYRYCRSCLHVHTVCSSTRQCKRLLKLTFQPQQVLLMTTGLHCLIVYTRPLTARFGGSKFN